MSGKRFALLCVALLAAAVAASVAIVLVSTPRFPLTPTLVLVTSDCDQYDLGFAQGARAAARSRSLALETVQLCDGRLQGTESLSHLARPDVFGVIVSRSVNKCAPLAVQQLAERTNVVTCGEDVWPSPRLCYVGTGDYSSGRACANVAMAALEDDGRILLLVDNVNEGASAARLEGFRQQLQETSSSLIIAAALEDSGDVGRCSRNLQQAFLQHPSIDCVIDLGDRTERPTAKALSAIARETNAKLITFDRSDAAMAEFEAGHVHAVIGDDPFQQGYHAVARLTSFFHEGEMSLPAPGRGQVHVPALVVRQRPGLKLGARPRSSRQAPASWAAM